MKILNIDYQGENAAAQFAQSLRDTGFAVIHNHLIDPTVIKSVYDEWEEFFSSTCKLDYKFDPQTQAGYFPFKSENAKDSPIKDLKEFYHLFPTTVFPAGLTENTARLRHDLKEMAKQLLKWVELGTPEQHKKNLKTPLSEMIQDSEGTLLRILHYPPLDKEREEGAVRASAHEDINLITLLVAATTPGLQVIDSMGDWHEVSCDPGSVVVNVGDMLALATEYYYKSTTHRVVNPTGENVSRYSMPLFLHPRRAVELAPGFTAGQYLEQRLRELGLIK